MTEIYVSNQCTHLCDIRGALPVYPDHTEYPLVSWHDRTFDREIVSFCLFHMPGNGIQKSFGQLLLGIMLIGPPCFNQIKAQHERPSAVWLSPFLAKSEIERSNTPAVRIIVISSSRIEWKLYRLFTYIQFNSSFQTVCFDYTRIVRFGYAAEGLCSYGVVYVSSGSCKNLRGTGKKVKRICVGERETSEINKNRNTLSYLNIWYVTESYVRRLFLTPRFVKKERFDDYLSLWLCGPYLKIKC